MPPMRLLSLTLGVLVLAAIWLGPLLSEWRESFAAHMLAHMGVVTIAAPLIAFGLRDAFGSGKVARASRYLALPVVASLVEFIVVWGWHAPAPRAWVERSFAATALEQGSFLAAGLFLWLSCLAIGTREDMAHRAAGAFGLLLTTVHMTLLGALLGLSPRPLYGPGDVVCFGTTLTAAQDQQLGAVIMLLVGAAVYLAGGVALMAGVLAGRSRMVA
ncbi:cytochrome c oxidase assembly protein [Mesorhizobium sp. LHD-90]|uniref:cytochrome c oxidase assembly protein n=1 Tax=Mesorhizobium sp. LHD-90 TaxID=3071414 RepID=UPI0027E04D5E|nr:cytochrome c oxidase assembly protein [Mesorhizobium sp. LHD-90]MDQ6432734.1 cytochrome c oxidase assembly protein [Mesorhizobium sp. LHD-90]